MKKNSFLNIVLIILITIILLGGLSVILINYMLDKTTSQETGSKEEMNEPSAKDLEELTVSVEEIVTNLASENVIQISFSLQASNKKTSEELKERMFQINDLILTLLHKTTKEQLQEEDGLDKIKATIMENVNTILHEGEVSKVFITSSMLQ